MRLCSYLCSLIGCRGAKEKGIFFLVGVCVPPISLSFSLSYTSRRSHSKIRKRWERERERKKLLLRRQQRKKEKEIEKEKDYMPPRVKRQSKGKQQHLGGHHILFCFSQCVCVCVCLRAILMAWHIIAPPSSLSLSLSFFFFFVFLSSPLGPFSTWFRHQINLWPHTQPLHNNWTTRQQLGGETVLPSS